MGFSSCIVVFISFYNLLFNLVETIQIMSLNSLVLGKVFSLTTNNLAMSPLQLNLM